MNRHIYIANKLLILLSVPFDGKTKKESKSAKTKYVYEHTKYDFADNYASFNWTKSTIKQFLYYVSVVNTHGEAFFVEDAEIKAVTGISTRTIEENNRAFKKAGLITYYRCHSKATHITIHNFQENVRDIYEEPADTTSEEGTREDEIHSEKVTSKTGYTSIWHEDMQKLLAIDNVNELRFALRCFAWYELDITVNKRDTWFISYGRLSMGVPAYLRYPAAIKSLAKKLTSLLPISIVSEYEDLKHTFQEYGNRGKNVTSIFTSKLVGVLSRFQDDKTRRASELREGIHEMQLFMRNLKQHRIAISYISEDNLGTLIDKYGVKALKAAFNRIYSYLETYTGTERLLLENQLTQTAEDFLYSILNRINLKTLV